MTSIAQTLPVRTASGSSPDLASEAQSVTWQATALMLALLIPTALGVLFDARLTDGLNGWIKPMKFQASLAIHYATLALLIGFMTPAARARRLIRWSMTAAAGIGLLEVAYIMLQAGRARASHFNSATSFENTAYILMGLGATTLVILTFMAGFVLWRHPRAGLSPAIRLAAGGGLMFCGAATLVVAGVMSQLGAHWVGVPSNAGLPIVGWSTVGGDLRVPHFFATHVAQVVPLFALAWARRRPDGAMQPVAIFLAIYAVFTPATFVQALMGRPFLPA